MCDFIYYVFVNLTFYAFVNCKDVSIDRFLVVF